MSRGDEDDILDELIAESDESRSGNRTTSSKVSEGVHYLEINDACREVIAVSVTKLLVNDLTLR
jgi:hypothetical protein